MSLIVQSRLQKFRQHKLGWASFVLFSLILGSNGRSRVYAATKFFLYTQIAGLVMLIGILGLVVYGYMMTGMIGFDYNYLLYDFVILAKRYQ